MEETKPHFKFTTFQNATQI